MAEVAAKGSVLSPYGRRSTGVSWRKRSPLCVGFPHCLPLWGSTHGRGSWCNSGGFHGGRLVLGDRRGKLVNRIAVSSPVQEIQTHIYKKEVRADYGRRSLRRIVLRSRGSRSLWSC